MKEDLKSKNINSLFHYIPLHSSKFSKKKFKDINDLKITNLISKSIIRMPIHLSLKKKEVIKIINLLKKYFDKNLTHISD